MSRKGDFWGEGNKARVPGERRANTLLPACCYQEVSTGWRNLYVGAVLYLFVELFEMRQLLIAGAAPGCPQVDQQRFSLESNQLPCFACKIRDLERRNL